MIKLWDLDRHIIILLTIRSKAHGDIFLSKYCYYMTISWWIALIKSPLLSLWEVINHRDLRLWETWNHNKKVLANWGWNLLESALSINVICMLKIWPTTLKIKILSTRKDLNLNFWSPQVHNIYRAKQIQFQSMEWEEGSSSHVVEFSVSDGPAHPIRTGAS